MFHFQLVSITGKKYDEDVHEVVLPTLDGQIGVLARHMPLVSVVAPGVIMVRKDSKTSDMAREFFATSGGVIEVSNNMLRVLVDEADLAEEINAEEAQKALDRAQKMVAEATDQVSLEHAQSMVDRYEVRLQVAGLRRRHLK
ncbi:MAG TPA: ATP synthase F1 subunit epsilon [Candidatus Saccharimonadales bacterium]|nr:ATP synthase F1 subunit epsilon [Candidatus Saccharimonadales bacterium]